MEVIGNKSKVDSDTSKSETELLSEPPVTTQSGEETDLMDLGLKSQEP